MCETNTTFQRKCQRSGSLVRPCQVSGYGTVLVLGWLTLLLESCLGWGLNTITRSALW